MTAFNADPSAHRLMAAYRRRQFEAYRAERRRARLQRILNAFVSAFLAVVGVGVLALLARMIGGILGGGLA